MEESFGIMTHVSHFIKPGAEVLKFVFLLISAETFPSNPIADINGSKVIYRISRALRGQKRKLKLTFSDQHLNEQTVSNLLDPQT